MGLFDRIFGTPDSRRSLKPGPTHGNVAPRPANASRPRARTLDVDAPAPVSLNASLSGLDGTLSPGPGWRERAIAGTDHFAANLARLPLGPVKVTLKLKPNDTNPHAVAAYVGNKQLGWLATDWSASDPHVRWIKRLENSGICPRFPGICRNRGHAPPDRIVNFVMPSDDRLTAIATELVASISTVRR